MPADKPWWEYEPGEAPFDLDRLSRDERELWEEVHGDEPWSEQRTPLLSAWSFGHWCHLFGDGCPAVVSEYLDQVDPEDRLGKDLAQYLENLRKAGRLK